MLFPCLFPYLCPYLSTFLFPYFFPNFSLFFIYFHDLSLCIFYFSVFVLYLFDLYTSLLRQGNTQLQGHQGTAKDLRCLTQLLKAICTSSFLEIRCIHQELVLVASFLRFITRQPSLPKDDMMIPASILKQKAIRYQPRPRRTPKKWSGWVDARWSSLKPWWIKPRQNQKLDDPKLTKLTAASSGMSVGKPWRWAKWQDAESNSRPEAAQWPGEWYPWRIVPWLATA